MSALVQARPPFTADGYFVKDADGDVVVTCDESIPPCGLYKDKVVNDWCRTCGLLWIWMEWATPEQCGIEVKP